jgi:uncharacterized protein
MGSLPVNASRAWGLCTTVVRMGLRERFTEEMKAAMKAKATRRLSTVRLILAAIQQQDISSRRDINEDEVLAVLARMIKQREESAATYDSGGRPELAQAEREEITIIREFMPKQLDENETRAAVKDAIEAAGATAMKDMGKVMAVLKENHAGQMDFGKASALVKELLSAAQG